MVTPRKKDRMTPTMPTVSEIRAPWMIRESMSRPRESAPRRWNDPLSAGPSRPIPKKWRSVEKSPQKR